MAALFCNTRQMVLGPATEDIGEWKRLVADVLGRVGLWTL
jgi:hypothetical protein